MYILASFYGILGLVQSAPDNGAYAVNGWTGSSITDQGVTGNTNHQPWVQGKAVTVYGTLAWLSAFAGVGSAAGVWSLPRLSGGKVL